MQHQQIPRAPSTGAATTAAAASITNTVKQQPVNLEAMNREKVASILSYLDDVDNESSCSSIAPSSSSAVASNYQRFTAVSHSIQQQYPSYSHHPNHHEDPLMISEQHHHEENEQEEQHWSPSPAAPNRHQQQQQQNHNPQGFTRSSSSSISHRSASYPQQHQQLQQHHLLQQQQQQQQTRSPSFAPSDSASNVGGGVEHSILSGTATSANAAYGGLRRKVNALVAERDAATRQVETLKQQLQSAEERERSRVSQVRDEVEDEGRKSRKHLQSAVDEHLKCIRKLLSEKEGMMKKVEELKSEVASASSKREAEIKRLRELHDKSLHDLRSRLSAQERSKRDEWSQKEAKRIKESTMKAMEPDIALLLNRHKSEKKRLEEELNEVSTKKEQIAAMKEKEMQEFKNKLVREMDETNQRERESFRTRMQEQTDRLMRSLEEEKRIQDERRMNLEKNHEEVRASLVSQLTEMAKKLAEAERRDQQRACHSTAETAEAVQKAQAEMAEQHRQMRQALEKERSSLSQSVQAASEQLLEARTAEIRQQCQSERDAAISKVVERLEAEQMKALNESKEAEKRWKEVNGQLQREIDRLRTELECTSAHFRSAKESVTARDSRIRELQEQLVSVKHIQTTESNASEESFERRLTSLDNTWQQRVQNLQAEHVRATESLTAEVTHLRRQLELLKEEHTTESNVASQKHNSELAVINERVSLTLNKKEAQIRQLSDTISSLQRQVQLRDEELARHDALLEDA